MSETAIREQETMEAFTDLQQHMESIEPGQPIVVPASVAAGDAPVWQGDLGIYFLSEVPEGYTLAKDFNGQLVPGNTEGSRHTLRDVTAAKVYLPPAWGEDEDSLEGPCFVAIRECVIDHPKHGSVTLPAGDTVFSTRYQREWDAMQARERRNRD